MINAIKYGLQNYHHFPNWIDSVDLKIEAIDTLMTKSGGSIVKKPEGNFDRQSFLISQISRKGVLENLKANYQFYIDLVDNFINSLKGEEYEIMSDKYINGISHDELCYKYFFSPRTLYRHIDRIIENYSKEFDI